jgi:hypothetical protein
MTSVLEVPYGEGFFYGDGEYNSKDFLDKIIIRGYLPIIRPKKRNPKSLGARIRDEIYDEEKYRERSICEGFFGALTNWFGGNVPCFLYKTTLTRICIRIVAYALRILFRLNIN